MRDVDQVREWIVHRRLPRSRHRDRDEVGSLALAPADPISFSSPSARAPSIVAIWSASRAGTALGSLVCSFARNAACRIASNMSRSLLLAAPSVPRPTTIPAARITDDPGGAARQLHVAFRIVRYGHVMAGKNGHVRRRQPDAMCGHGARPPEAYRLEILRGRRLVRLLGGLHLVGRLRQVDQDRRVLTIGEGTCGLEGRGIEGVHRVRCDRGDDQVVPCELLDECLGARQAVLGCFRVGDGKLNDRLSQHTRAGPTSCVTFAISSSK